MVLAAGKIGQVVGHVPRFVGRLRLHQCFDQIRRHRECAGIEDALAQGVVPHRPEVRCGRLEVPGEQRCDSQGPLRFQPVPPHSGVLRALQSLRAPAPRVVGVSAPRCKERAATLVHRPVQQLAVGGGGPFVEQPLSVVPISDPEHELAQVEPQQRVRRRLCPLLGQHLQRGEHVLGLPHLSPPDVTLAGYPLGALRQEEAVLGHELVPLRQVGDRVSTQSTDPGQRVQRETLVIGSVGLAGGQGLGRPLLGLREVGDLDHRPVLGQFGEHRRS